MTFNGGLVSIYSYRYNACRHVYIHAFSDKCCLYINTILKVSIYLLPNFLSLSLKSRAVNVFAPPTTI